MAKIKGICRNIDGCDKASNKEVQEVEKSEFFCLECGKPLYPVEETAKENKRKGKNASPNWLLIGLIAGIVAIGGVIATFFLWNRNDTFEDEIPTAKQEIVSQPEQPVVAEEPAVEIQEEVAPEAAPVEETKSAPVEDSKPSSTAPAQSTSRNKDLGYASWKGALKNGQPNDENGTMTFKESHRIDSRDPQARVAEPGDYIIGEYVDGKLVQGVWYDKTNTVKGSIIIGR